MKYQDVCDNNKMLYGQLELCTYALMELDQVIHAEQYKTIQEEKDHLQYLINLNIERLEILWQTMPVEVGIYRCIERGEGKRVIEYYINNNYPPLGTIASALNIAPMNVSRYIGLYLKHKHAF